MGGYNKNQVPTPLMDRPYIGTIAIGKLISSFALSTYANYDSALREKGKL
jgi:hypothetical protein